ncbi:MAG: tetratricopeptide repeat protein [Treponema sp.]|jgi:tetratricopeptide (TPR) repeat protein|nr:tetratricopeptide repeat protein [Treponema sp.]
MAKKGTAKSLVIVILAAAAITGVFVYKKISTRNSLAAQIAALSSRGAPPGGIEDLRKAIALYEKKIEQNVRDAAQTGSYWKILGSRLVDRGLYGEALEALERAAEYYPEDESVHYLLGLSAGNLAQSEYFDPARQEEHFSVAERAYLRALTIDGRYGKALYGISILYVFALGRPAEAVPYLRRFLDINTSDTDAMFVLANAYFQLGETQNAVDLYDTIIGITKDPAKKRQAETNKAEVLGRSYG